MGKTTRPSPLNIIDDHIGEWASHPAVEWLNTNKQKILWVFLSLLLLLVVAYRFISHYDHQAENDYYRADAVFAQFQKEVDQGNKEQAALHLQDLKAIIARHPELKAKYEGELAQDLIILGEAAQAGPLSKEVFQRTIADAIQFYQNYSTATLLISENQYQRALEQTIQLQENLNPLVHEKGFEYLFAYNMLRLAMLHQQLGHQGEELQTWERIEQLPSNIKVVLDNSQSQTDQRGNASLNQYINQRKKALRK